jgi:hypothetical protein
LTIENIYHSTTLDANMHVVSLVRQIINEYRQNDPEVASDVLANNVVWKPKDDWPRLMEAMRVHSKT